ncbi:MAG: hypothetical protein U9N46_01075 [Euryarchaeota archaeon]|nr:hypothetical protein [Euryarchaeota archaeon]
MAIKLIGMLGGIYTRAEAEGFDKAYVEEVLGRLKTQGELYEPTPEYVRLT